MEKILKIAEAAGGFHESRPLIEREYWVFPSAENVKEFLALASEDLVTAAVNIQREKVARWMIANGYATGHGEKITDLLEELRWQIEERIAMAREQR